MSGFSAEWLALRAPVDAAARSEALAARVLAALRDRHAVRGTALAAPARVVDLGCGTGANLRVLGPQLGIDAEWVAVDHDPVLLEALQRAPDVASLPRVTVTVRHADLRQALPGLVMGAALVTASALFDLVSETWLQSLVAACRAEDALVLAVLNYDGRLTCTPSDPDDAFVRDLVNAHQRTDKGFGPALGPTAAARFVSLLRAAGYEVEHERSDWHIDSSARALQVALLLGWRDAAVEMAPAARSRVSAWVERRLAHVDAGHSVLIVGHEDVAGLLPGRA